jgi:peptidoglycan hydrolase-like protein with peptidoglycan-binding domain
VDGPATRSGVVALQRRKGLVPDGVVGPKTLAALGGRTSELGARVLVRGASDSMSRHSSSRSRGTVFPSGALDGVLGARTEFAIRRFQRWARLEPDGVVGPATVAALAQPVGVSPLRLEWPLVAPISDPFGPRGSRFPRRHRSRRERRNPRRGGRTGAHRLGCLA